MSIDNEKRSVDDRLQQLSPAQRALLEQKLMQRASTTARRAQIARRSVEGPLVLSYAQELLWLLSQVFDDGIAYNAPGAFQLEGPLDLGLLRRAFEALMQRHEILRTTYDVFDGRPMQVVGSAAEIEVNLVDISHLDADAQHEESQRILKQESRFRFDLVNGPVIRPTVIRLGPERHILMVNMHHLATDGYSRSAIYRDLTAFYDAFLHDREPALEPLKIQYGDYAIWQREWLDGGIADAQLEYWKKKLARAPSQLDLPTDLPRPAVRSYVGNHLSVMLDIATRESLRSAARDADATLFVGLLSTFAALLGRYAGQDDVVIGTPFAGRNRTELESMVGYFINPLALRVDLSGDPTFRELLGRARETTLEAFAHADVPYETVVRAVNPERDLSQTPVFQAMIVLHNPAWQTQRPKFEPEGIRCAEITHEKGWAKFDVLLGMSERTTGLNTTWEYSTELFERPTVLRMAEHFRSLAQSAAANPDRPLSRVPMLSEAERNKVLFSWNQHRDPLPRADSIKQLFEAQARRTPAATAVVFEDQRLTFEELNRRANQIAWRLQAAGVGPGTRVGVLMEKSIDLVPSVLGVVKAGGAYIPLDPLYPADRIEFMVGDSDPSVLLTSAQHADSARETGVDVLVVDLPATLSGMSEADPPQSAGPDDLAYIIYTSGSTGQPKGAMIANRSLVSAYYAYERAYRLKELTAHAQMASFSFDVFTGDMIRSLLAGAKLVLCPITVVVDPPRLYELMVREQIDMAEFVPATASLLFEHLHAEGKRLDFMKLVVVSSEAWRGDRYAFFKSLCGPDTRLVNSYGLTEATIDSTWFEAAPGQQLIPGRFVPIGRPLENTQIYVLDSHLEPQPIGVAGELCVGGVAVARGYLNRPELSAQKFVADPFSDEPDALLYRTGDLARWLPDGTIDFLGRTDRQIKIRGFRIEPGEIESVLEGHDSVSAASVTDRVDEGGSARLVAYVVPADPSQPPAPDTLRTLVADHLPAYMIPAAWVMIDSLPVTPNGKVDFAALPDPEFDRSANSDEFVAPRTQVERDLAEVWSDVLGVQEIGVHDNFFALGGHSLLAVKLFAEIDRKLGVSIPLAALFQTATIAGLAEIVEQQRGTRPVPDAGEADSVAPGPRGGWSAIVPMRPGDGDRPLFLIGWAGGEVLGYRELVESLRPTIPIYGLRAPGVDRDRLPLASIEAMASHFIEQIRSVQPHGPYRLGGYCFSGLIAFEMGAQLLEQGETLDLLALIDSYPHGSSRRPTRIEIEREKLKAFRSVGPRGKAQWVRRRAVGLKNRIRDELYFRSGQLVYDQLAARGWDRVPHGPWRLVLVASSRARRLYVPRAADLRVEFFRAQREPDDRPTPWEHLALGGVELRQVVVPQVNHESMMHRPHVQFLAEQLSDVLERVASAESRAAVHSSNGAAPPGASNGTTPPGNGAVHIERPAGVV